jgi:O-acetylserine/cysteine efflux transporter
LASIVVQTQALFTILVAGVVLKEKPTRRQLCGTAVAFTGLAVIAMTVGHDLTAVGLCLTAMSAVSWGLGNVLVKRLPQVDMLNLMVWLSLVPPLPSLVLSIALDGPAGITRAVTGASWLAVCAALYLGLVATVLAYAIWGNLLSRYSAATVTPFALLAPFVAAYASSLVFGERFGALRLAGMGLVLLGLAVIVLPLERLAGRRPSP